MPQVRTPNASWRRSQCPLGQRNRAHSARGPWDSRAAAGAEMWDSSRGRESRRPQGRAHDHDAIRRSRSVGGAPALPPKPTNRTPLPGAPVHRVPWSRASSQSCRDQYSVPWPAGPPSAEWRGTSPTPKDMTRAQFEQAKLRANRAKQHRAAQQSAVADGRACDASSSWGLGTTARVDGGLGCDSAAWGRHRELGTGALPASPNGAGGCGAPVSPYRARRGAAALCPGSDTEWDACGGAGPGRAEPREGDESVVWAYCEADWEWYPATLLRWHTAAHKCRVRWQYDGSEALVPLDAVNFLAPARLDPGVACFAQYDDEHWYRAEIVGAGPRPGTRWVRWSGFERKYVVPVHRLRRLVQCGSYSKATQSYLDGDREPMHEKQFWGRAPHAPALLAETLVGLQAAKGGVFIDGTFGAGGHSAGILGSHPSNRVFAVDADIATVAVHIQRIRFSCKECKAAIKYRPTSVHRAKFGSRFRFMHGMHGDLAAMAQQNGIAQVDGVLLDVGQSSMQIDTADRGHSYQLPGPLDMRYDQSDVQCPTAEEVVNTYSLAQLCDILRTQHTFSEGRIWRLANIILDARLQQRLTSTGQLRGALAQHFTSDLDIKLVFQSLRQYINGDVDQLVSAGRAAWDLLRRGGRLCVIVFKPSEEDAVQELLRTPPWVGKCASYSVTPAFDDYLENSRVRTSELHVITKQ